MEADDPQPAVARPVPREWLAPYAADAAHLDRLCADVELTEQMRQANYQGRDWDYVAEELIKYGYAVLIGWMRSGVIWKRLADYNIRGLPAPPARQWDDEAWQELADFTMAIGVEKFRDTVLIPGRWDPRKRASLKTFFIGQCLFRFPNVYRSWYRNLTASEEEIPAEASLLDFACGGVAGPERQVVLQEQVARELAGLDDRTRTVLVLLEQGYDQSEVAGRLGTTRKSIEMIVRRNRVRRQQHGEGQHGAAS